MNNITNRNIFLTHYKVYMLLILLSTLYLFQNSALKIIGGMAIVIILTLAIVDVLVRKSVIKINAAWFWFYLYMAYSIVQIIRTFSVDSVYTGVLQVVLLLPLCSFTSLKLRGEIIDQIILVCKRFSFLILIFGIVVMIRGTQFSFEILINYLSPSIYKILLPCSFFILVNTKSKFYKMVLISFILFGIGERASFLSVYVIYFTYVFLKNAKKSKIMYNIFFVAFSLALVLFPILYINLQYTSLGDLLTVLSHEYTNSNFFSGRNVIWEIAYDEIRNSPIIGYGIDHTALTSNEINISTHNLYIYILLQGGVLGLFIFFMFIKSIWNYLFFALDDEIVRLAAAFLIGAMFLASFELILIVNGVTISLFIWFVIGIGIIQRNNRDLKSQYNVKSTHRQ